jgi:3-methyladenine DNA glycosylase AlkD
VASRLLQLHPGLEATYRRWAADEHQWVRRSGVLAFLGVLRHEETFDEYFPSFTEIVDPLLTDNRFFVRKAIGWVLREASKKHPDDVYAWIAPRAGHTSGVTMREVVRYLGDARRTELLAVAKAGRRRG